jgi:hypothetical protein
MGVTHVFESIGRGERSLPDHTKRSQCCHDHSAPGALDISQKLGSFKKLPADDDPGVWIVQDVDADEIMANASPRQTASSRQNQMTSSYEAFSSFSRRGKSRGVMRVGCGDSSLKPHRLCTTCWPNSALMGRDVPQLA